MRDLFRRIAGQTPIVGSGWRGYPVYQLGGAQGPPVVEDAPEWILVEAIEVTGSPTSSVTFSGLDGQSEVGYMIQGFWQNSDAPAARRLSLFPNGLAADPSRYNAVTVIARTGLAPAVITSTTNELSLVFSQGSLHTFYAYMLTAESGVASSRGFFGYNDIYFSAATAFREYLSGGWFDSSVDISSLVIRESANNASIGVGSWFRLYKSEPVAFGPGQLYPWTDLANQTLLADADSVTFAGLNGNSQNGYLLEGLWINSDFPTTRALTLQPNGIIINQRCVRTVYGSSGPLPFTSGLTSMVLSFTNTQYNYIQAQILDARTSAGRRLYLAESAAMPADAANVFGECMGGQWDDPITNISSLVIAVDGGSQGIGAGSWFRLSNRVE